MASHHPLMKYGTIYKRETLINAFPDAKNNYLVLKSNDPFPGFYCSEKNPADNSCKENSYYLPVYGVPHCHEDIICRISLEIYKDTKIQVCGAHMLLGGKFVNAIRIKGTEAEGIEKIVSVFIENNIRFYKQKNVSTYLSKIYLKSFFTVKEISTSVFQNTISSELFYFEIPEKLDWATFEQLITYQKTHSSFKNFDAAPGYWIHKPAFTDFVRVYGKKLKLTQLLTIKEDFLYNLAQYREQKILI